MTYQEAITNLNSITKVEKEEDLETIFSNCTFLVRYFVKSTYSRLDYSDSEDIANEVGIRILEKFKNDKNFQVTNWSSYLSICMRDIFKQSYRHNGKIQSLSYLNPDNTEDEFDLIQEELDPDNMIDFKKCVEASYLKLQDIVSKIPIRSEESRIILERLITFAVAIDESILDMLPPTLKRISKASYAALRSELSKYREQGLLTSKVI